ncbi:MAG: nickel pincer cofactor biosynthesis protein LarC [Bradymonadaceae bacterium]|nr:nickel pincer cofactor biosynthesis protein LarC [Lujinxingiaceae bacterium]
MHIHLDLLGGLAGDMFLAAAIDAELVDIEALEAALCTLGLGRGIRIVCEKVMRGAISGTHVRFEGWDLEAEADHRHLSTILEMIDQSGLQPGVKARAKDMFNVLGQAEAAIHGIALERVHFHEVGAVDSLLDFVSAAWIVDRVSASWSVSDVPAGRGTIVTDHGTIPVPAPATAKLLEGFAVVYRDIEAELVTPTGAAILRSLRPSFAPARGILQTTGFGCGTRNMKALSNVVRFVVLEQAASELKPTTESDVVWRVATEIDDMNPEILAHVEQLLLDAGALDVVREPVLMKKGRQGVRLSLLCGEDHREALIETIFRQTSTFGLRVDTVERRKLDRESRLVETPFGSARVKLGYLAGELIKATPEYADCAKLAQVQGVALQDVYQAVQRAAAALLES